MLKEKQAIIKEDKPSHVRKNGTAVNKRLLTGLIVSLIVMVALAIGRSEERRVGKECF